MEFSFTGSREELAELMRQITNAGKQVTANAVSYWDTCIPAPGTKFTYKDQDYIALGIEQGGLLAITDGPICEMPFDGDIRANWQDSRANWRESGLRKYLNGEWLDEISTNNLILQTTDLTADDGGKDYGETTDYVSLLTDAQYRKYRAYIPNFNTWWWTATPSPSLDSKMKTLTARL
mgnify:CR=1 FL=1